MSPDPQPVEPVEAGTPEVVMDATQAQGNRAERRRLARMLGQHSSEAAKIAQAPSEARTDCKHGVCRECGKRRIVWLPAYLCEQCLVGMAVALGELFNEEAVQKGGRK